MSNFVVSARKYRPLRFMDVVGQAHVSTTLKNALRNDHLAHAFLFCGPRGVGKTTCARILAKVLNCQNLSPEHEPCNECSSCRSFNENASFNITELDAASNNSVEHIRALIEQVRFQPQQGKYKIYIIDEVHMLSSQAFNAFLKTLEEPPSYAIFILATTEKHKIIPTILSRCQIFDFKRIQVQDMVAHLQGICEAEGIQADPDALHIIAQKADGALRDALSIFDRMVSFSGNTIEYAQVIEHLNVLDYDYYFRFTEALLREDISEVLLIFDDVLKKGFEPDIFLVGLAEHLRNLLVCKDAATLSLLELSEGLRGRYDDQAKLAPPSFLLSGLNLLNECDIHFKMARNKRLHVEMTLIKLAYINRTLQIDPEKKTVVASAPPPADEKKEVVSKPPVEKTVAAPPPKPSPRSAKLSLEALDAEVVKEETTAVPYPTGELQLEQLQAVWNEYTEGVSADSVKSILEGAALSIEKDKLVATVGSKLAENTILQEMDLMEFLRKALNLPNLLREVRIDQDKATSNQLPPRKKPLSPKEKYLKLNETNPLVNNIRERFDLSPEGE